MPWPQNNFLYLLWPESLNTLHQNMICFFLTCPVELNHSSWFLKSGLCFGVKTILLIYSINHGPTNNGLECLKVDRMFVFHCLKAALSAFIFQKQLSAVVLNTWVVFILLFLQIIGLAFSDQWNCKETSSSRQQACNLPDFFKKPINFKRCHDSQEIDWIIPFWKGGRIYHLNVPCR